MSVIPRIDGIDKRPLTLRDGHLYLAREGLLAAVNAALTLRRPLLLTGEPGSGKTRFAEACAHWFATYWSDIGGSPAFAPASQEAVCIVRSDSRARDLLYRYDALARFGDAQLAGSARTWAQNPRNYLSLEPLGRSLVKGGFSVVLIDEIDKSPRDLPNDLLDVLEDRRFEIGELREVETPEYQQMLGEPLEQHTPPLQRWMYSPDTKGEWKHQTWPLIVISSNTERQLPTPFLRRCVCHHLMPFERDELIQIVRDRFPNLDSGTLALGEALVDFFLWLRAERLEKPPSTSELIDASEVVHGELLRAHKDRAWAQAMVDAIQVPDKTADRSQTKVRKAWRALSFFGCLVKLEADIKKVTE